MPNPIGSANSAPNSSHYDSAECDPTLASCAEAPPPEARTVTLDPVRIEAHPKHQPPTCSEKRDAAMAGCAALGTSFVVTGLTVATPLSPLALSGFVMGAVGCARLISDYYDCRDLGIAMTEVVNACEAKGGLALAGAAPNEVICLVEP